MLSKYRPVSNQCPSGSLSYLFFLLEFFCIHALFLPPEETLHRINSQTISSAHPPPPYSVPPAAYCAGGPCEKNKIDKMWLEVPRRRLGDRGGRTHGVSTGRRVCPGGPRGGRRLLATKQRRDVSIRPPFPSPLFIDGCFSKVLCMSW